MTHFSDVDAVPMSLIALPLSDILLPIIVPPQSVALHGPILEIPDVVLLCELEPPLPMSFIILKIPKIDRTVRKLHVPLPRPIIQTKLPLINRIQSNLHPVPMLHIHITPPEIQGVTAMTHHVVLLVE